MNRQQHSHRLRTEDSTRGQVCGLFSKSAFSKNSFRNNTRVSNRLDQDQARRFVGPDLGPNCLQRLSADDTTVGKELNN